MSNHDTAENLVASWGMVLKDFPDDLVEQVMETGDMSLLENYEVEL